MRETLARLVEYRELAVVIPVLLAGLLGGVFTGRILFRVFFRSRKHFLQCVRYLYQPEWVSLCLGEFWRDVGGTLRFFVWLALALGGGVACLFLSIPLVMRMSSLLAH
ncbi:MAG: hypothetical protein K8R23_18680 [Chthoniobacter sp.]|nr:hypothetical protein [Chthoniobacter sp.]